MPYPQSSFKSLLLFGGVAAAVFAVVTVAMRTGVKDEAVKTPADVTTSPKESEKPDEDDWQKIHQEAERKSQFAAIVKSRKLLLEQTERDSQDQKRQKDREERERTEQERRKREQAEAKKAEQAGVGERDKHLREKCMAFVKPPKVVHTQVGRGVLEVSCPLNTLYMLTGGYDGEGKYHRSLPGDDQPLYSAGGSSLQLSISYDDGGRTVLPTDGWLKVNGKAEKVLITSSDTKVLRDDFATGIFTPESPGESTVIVSVAGESIKFPVLVVPLDIAGNETTDAVIKKYGIPDDDLFIHVAWPDSKTIHGIHYYDNLKFTSRTMGHHWKFNRFPGAVVVVDNKKVYSVSSTTLDFAWPKDEERRFQERLRGR